MITEKQVNERLKALAEQVGGDGLKIAIFESILTNHHLIVACIIKWLPNAEIRFFSNTNGYEVPIREMLEWGAHICNMSFIGWDPDQVKAWSDKYRNIRENPFHELYDMYDEFFNTVICVCASGNERTKEEHDYNFPSGTEIWEDEVISVGALQYNTVTRTWSATSFSSGNDRVDFSMPSITYYESKYNQGTSFSTPRVTLMCGILLSQCKELIGKPRIVAKLLRNMSIDIDAEGKDINTGYGLISPRLLMDKEIIMKFVSGESKFTVGTEKDVEVKEIIGIKYKQPVPVKNYIENGKTSGAIYDMSQELVKQMEGCYVPKEASKQMDELKSWTSDSSTIKVVVKY